VEREIGKRDQGEFVPVVRLFQSALPRDAESAEKAEAPVCFPRETAAERGGAGDLYFLGLFAGHIKAKLRDQLRFFVWNSA
jgi:hypothetical protein